jgi:hypothetical protein
MFEILIALGLFFFIYMFSDSLIISGIATMIILGIFGVTVDVDKAKIEFDQVAGIETVVGVKEAIARSPNRTYPKPVVEQGQYTSRAKAPTNIEARYINNGIRDKWIAVDLWRTDRGGIAACYTDNEPGTNCFKPTLRRHTDGALYACFEDGNCHIVRE